MLSYKEYKQLNESLYGAFNLGLKSPQNVGGIVSASSVNGTEAALEAQAEEAIEEAKKMKKKMCGDEEEVSVDSEDEEKDDEVEEEDSEDSEEDSEDEDEDSEDEDEDSDEEEDEDKVVEVPKMMKKKAKKEWTEALSDLEEIVSEIADKETFEEAKKGFNFVRDVLNKKAKGKDNKDKDNKDKEGEKEEEGGEGLTAAQKKLPKKLQDAILKNKKKKKKNKDDEEEKNCNKCVSEGDKSWWDSVNSMINADPNAKNWDGMFSKVEEIETGIRDEERPV